MSTHMTRTVKISVATALWIVTVGLGLTWTIFGVKQMVFWAVLSALLAHLLTIHVLNECTAIKERIRVERLVDGILARAYEAAQDDPIPRIR